MSDHNIKSLGDAIKALIETMKWQDNFSQATIIADWEKVAGREIALHTTDIKFKNGVLTLKLNSSVLRHELHMRKGELAQHINAFYEKDMVKEIRLL